MNIRTDLAIEAHELTHRDFEDLKGINITTSIHGKTKKTIVDISNEESAKQLGKQCGKYITIEAPDLKYSLDDYEFVCKSVSTELKKLCYGNKTLIVGLGNREITPDALGCEVVSQLIITNHLKKYNLGFLDNTYGFVSAIAPGVMGTTGIETLDIIKGVTDISHPDTIIAVDALAGADINRICSTIQISDSGIAPGSGVANNRKCLNKSTLGINVIAIGVPTVIAAELIAGHTISDDYQSLMVTTKDIDLVIKRMSKTVANGINMALHKDISFRDIEAIID